VKALENYNFYFSLLFLVSLTLWRMIDMSQKKNIVIGAALAGLSVGMLSISTTVSAAEAQCWGVNSCGAKSSAKDKANCAVTEKQAATAKKEFGAKYSKAASHSCAGSAECAAKGGNINWTKANSKDECKKLGGFLMDKEGKIEKL
jgi:hypothetical protein